MKKETLDIPYFRYKRFRDTYKGVFIILSTHAEASWTNSKKYHYLNRGYEERKQGEKFVVRVDDLPFSSASRIDVSCPVCDLIYTSSLNRLNIKGSTLCPTCSGRYDLSGLVFGRLIAIRTIAGDNECGTRAKWLCKCECESICEVRTDQLTNGWTQSCGCIHMEYLENRVGENHPCWTGGSASRNIRGYMKWKEAVINRDDNACVVCTDRQANLHVHHLNCYSKYPDQAADVQNGVTLCDNCHYDSHIKHMNGYITPCTKNDFWHWLARKGIDYKPIQCKIEEYAGV